MLNSKFTTIPYKEFSKPMKVLTWVSGGLSVLSLIWIILRTFSNILPRGSLLAIFVPLAFAQIIMFYVLLRALWLGYQRKK